MGEHVGAQIRHHALADPDDEIVARRAGDGEQCRHAEQGVEVIVDEPGIRVAEAVVDHGLDGERQRQGRQGSQREEEQGGGNLTFVAGDIRQEAAQGAQSGGRGLLRFCYGFRGQ